VTKVSDFTQKKSSCESATNLTVDGCSVQVQAFEYLNGSHTSFSVPQLGHLQPKEFVSMSPFRV